MNLIEHWGSGSSRINQQLRDVGLRELEFIGGDTDLRIKIYRGQNADFLQDSADNEETADKLPTNCR